MDLIDRLNLALKYIEDNLTDEINMEEAAKKACCSPYYFQRIFSYMSGMTLSEYIRKRKMSMAAVDIQNGEKILDTAIKYGYNSPTSFNRAFQSVHQTPPSSLKASSVKVKSYPPISFKLTIKGAKEMNYRIEKRTCFRIVGKSIPMFGEIEKNMEIIPSFWNKAAVDGTIEKLCHMMNGDIKGMMGVCDCASPNNMKYFIAVNSHSDIPEDMEEYIVAERTWAVFYGEGECPSAIQNLEKDIYTDWLPSSGYEYDNGPDIELYFEPDPQNAKFEVWIPVKKSN